MAIHSCFGALRSFRKWSVLANVPLSEILMPRVKSFRLRIYTLFITMYKVL